MPALPLEYIFLYLAILHTNKPVNRDTACRTLVYFPTLASHVLLNDFRKPRAIYSYLSFEKASWPGYLFLPGITCHLEPIFERKQEMTGLCN